MANDRSKDRLESLKKTPLYKVTAWRLDWHNAPDRAGLADKMMWLGHTDHDEPIRKAFKYFELDDRDPQHWRILITYLAMGFFPNPKKDGKTSLKTLLANAELLKRANEIRDEIFKRENRRPTDTEILTEATKAFPRNYSKSQLANLRKRLNAARKAEGYFLAK